MATKKKELENLLSYRDELSYRLNENWGRQVRLQVDKNETSYTNTEQFITMIVTGIIAITLIGFFIYCACCQIRGCWLLMILAIIPAIASAIGCISFFDSRKKIAMMDIEASDLRSKEKVMVEEYKVVSDKIFKLEKGAEKKNGKRTKTTKTTNK